MKDPADTVTAELPVVSEGAITDISERMTDAIDALVINRLYYERWTMANSDSQLHSAIDVVIAHLEKQHG